MGRRIACCARASGFSGRGVIDNGVHEGTVHEGTVAWLGARGVNLQACRLAICR
jgi:hypothetical protein